LVAATTADEGDLACRSPSATVPGGFGLDVADALGILCDIAPAFAFASSLKLPAAEAKRVLQDIRRAVIGFGPIARGAAQKATGDT